MRRLFLVLCLVAALPFAAEAAKKPKPRPTCFGKRATIVGTVHSDSLVGTGHNDVIVGRAGNDRIDAGKGADLVCGGVGADVLDGQDGRDRLDGGAGFDVCRGAERLARCEETRPDPPEAPLEAGEYFLELAGVRFAFRVGDGWSFIRRTSDADVYRRKDPGGLHLAFFVVTDGPSAVIDRLARLTGVSSTPLVAASIDGVSGERVDLENTTSGYVAIPYGFDNALEATDRARFYAVRVSGKTLVVQIEAPDAEFAGFLAQAESVLAAVRFEP